MPKTAVIFTSNNARIVYYDKLEDLKDFSNVIIGANLDHAAGIPPHFWKFQDGVICGMNEQEQAERIDHINTNGLNNDARAKQTLAYEVELDKSKKAATDATVNLINNALSPFKTDLETSHLNHEANKTHLEELTFSHGKLSVILQQHQIASASLHKSLRDQLNRLGILSKAHVLVEVLIVVGLLYKFLGK